ncbi:autotransporter domain-containing protein, partial [Sinorhizobium meliloti]|uniref:autotransporter outer membrane beta-barrel domain-containing protein n=1 Tax=Rhizobium meliloti TaxID=382 RepID=UPI000FD6FE2F
AEAEGSEEGSGAFSASVGVSVGRTGGSGGSSGTVNVTTAGTISTFGADADGVLAQSIGGGGGLGGSVGQASSGDSEPLDDEGDSECASEGGNGDDGHGYCFGVSVGATIDDGGTGGTAANGNAVTLTHAGHIATAGDWADGIVAQSIGGGGGAGGNGGAVGITFDDNHGNSISTAGYSAYGVLLQSIGGGGGQGGDGSDEAAGRITVGGGFGGSGGAGGSGGMVTAKGWINLSTSGDDAHGIVAQSIGGGGGVGGAASGAPLSFTGNSPGSYGDGGDVAVTADGSIFTRGDYAFGVLAQSIGGGGGFGGNAASAFIGSNGNLSSDGKSGNVTVSLDAGRTIQASGKDSIGIFAQSDAGTDNNGTIDVTVNGTVTGGSGDNGAGIWVSAGKDNVVTVNSGGNVSAASGVAVQYTAGMNSPEDSALVVNNAGTISGSVKGALTVAAKMPRLARSGRDTVVSVVNKTGGVLTDAEIYEADVMNHGRLTIGQSGGIDATRITGDLTQDAGGILGFTADFAGFRMDRLIIDGDATLAGRFTVNAISVLPDISLPFLTVAGTLDHALSAESSIFDYSISRAGNELSVSADSAHFTDPGAMLNEDQINVAGHLQEVWDAGGGSFGTLFGTLGSLADRNSGDYAAALSDMSPGISGAAAAGSIAMTQQRLDLLLSCPMFADGTSALVETSCVWSQAGAQTLDQKASGGMSGFDTTTYALRAGAQMEVSPDWFVGIAGGYDRSSIRGDDGRVDADGDIIYAGASLKHEIGPWLLSGAVAGSYGWYDNTRTIRIPGFAGQAEGDPEIYNLSTRVRAAYTFAQDPYYVRPLVDLDLIYSHASGYRESGTGALDLLVDDAGQWSFHATPAIEVGTRVEVNETTVMRAFAGAGVSFSTVDSWDTSARLAGAPAGIGMFDSEVPLADVVGRVTAGLDLATD